MLAYHYGTALELAASCHLDLEDELLEPTSRYLALAGGRAAPLDATAAAAHFARAESVNQEASSPRRWLLSRRTRRTLQRRTPMLVGAVAVIAVAVVAALAIWVLGPSGSTADSDAARTMTPVQIADKYGPSVVKITTPVMPPASTETMEPSRIVGSGFMATKEGVIITSLAVIQGQGMNPPLTVRVEYALPTGEYGRATGKVVTHNEVTGIALIKVDPREVPLKPLLVGDSESIAEMDKVVALSAQGDMRIQWATDP